MIDRTAALAFIDSLPWPEGAIRPRLGLMTDGETWMVLLHKPIKQGWDDIANISGHCPEACLRVALEEWFNAMGLNNRPELYDRLKQLRN